MSHKQFKHNFLPELSMTTENIDGKRHYVLPNGEKFKSVTTILSERTDKSKLEEWRKRVGEEEANRISAIANRRGTIVHSLAEKYLLNDPMYSSGHMPIDIDNFNGIKKILDKNVDDILGIELPLFSRTLKCAGRTDLVANFLNTNSIIDFKTSLKNKREEWILNYFIQATIYGMMTEWIYKINIPQIVIIIAVDNNVTPQLFVKQKSQFVDKALEIFNGE